MHCTGVGVRSLHNERVKQGECRMSSHENWPSVGHGGCFANATSLAVRDQMHHISDGAIIYLQNRKKNQTCYGCRAGFPSKCHWSSCRWLKFLCSFCSCHWFSPPMPIDFFFIPDSIFLINIFARAASTLLAAVTSLPLPTHSAVPTPRAPGHQMRNARATLVARPMLRSAKGAREDDSYQNGYLQRCVPTVFVVQIEDTLCLCKV